MGSPVLQACVDCQRKDGGRNKPRSHGTNFFDWPVFFSDELDRCPLEKSLLFNSWKLIILRDKPQVTPF
jgi:hypothetical protein